MVTIWEVMQRGHGGEENMLHSRASCEARVADYTGCLVGHRSLLTTDFVSL